MEKKRFKAVIATDGRATMLVYNGKAYGDFITGVDFSHYVGEDPIMKITSDKEPLPPEGTMDMDTFKKFLEHVMSEDEKEKGIEVLVKPIVEWLKTQDPYLEVHISSEYIKLVRTVESSPVNETVSL